MSLHSNTSQLPNSTVIIYPAETITAGVYCTVVGLLGIASNIVTISVIRKNKKLHTPCFIFLVAQSVSNSFMAAGFVTDGVQRLGLSFGVLDLRYTRLTCYLIYVPKILGLPPGAYFTCAIGLDRFFGITFPVQYQKKAKRYVLIALLIGACISLSDVVAAGLAAPSPMTAIVTCANSFASFHPTFTRYYTNSNLTLCLLSVCSYACIVCVVKHRQAKKGKVADPTAAAAAAATKTQDQLLRSQMAILPMVRAVMVAYVLFGVCPEILAAVTTVAYEGMYLSKIGNYGVMLKVTSSCTDFFVLAFKSQEFKATLKLMFGLVDPNTSGCK